ncbi:MAG: hypothetical protein NXI04_13900 [Planctomycetaceae bacterium]|nr:hypothetical protein [Planctomycetaceae bacterium]
MDSANPYRSPQVSVAISIADGDVRLLEAFAGAATDVFRGAAGRRRTGFRLYLLACLSHSLIFATQSVLVWLFSDNLFGGPLGSLMQASMWIHMAMSAIVVVAAALLASAAVAPRYRAWGLLLAVTGELTFSYMPVLISWLGGSFSETSSLAFAAATTTLSLITVMALILTCRQFATDPDAQRWSIWLAGGELGVWLLSMAMFAAAGFDVWPGTSSDFGFSRMLQLLMLPVWLGLIWLQVRLIYRTLSALVRTDVETTQAASQPAEV